MGPRRQYKRMARHERFGVGKMRARVGRLTKLDFEIRKLQPEVSVILKVPVDGEVYRPSELDVLCKAREDTLVIYETNEQPPRPTTPALSRIYIVSKRV